MLSVIIFVKENIDSHAQEKLFIYGNNLGKEMSQSLNVTLKKWRIGWKDNYDARSRFTYPEAQGHLYVWCSLTLTHIEKN